LIEEYPNLAAALGYEKELENGEKVKVKVTHHVKASKFYYPGLRDSDVGDGEYFYVPDLRHMFISNTTDYS
jgi:hypothetical protein